MLSEEGREELSKNVFLLREEYFREIVRQAFKEKRITEGELYNIAEADCIGEMLYDIREMLKDLPKNLAVRLKNLK